MEKQKYLKRTEAQRMRKLLKIILAIFAVLIIIAAAFAAVIFLDVSAYTATGSQTLTPAGTSAGNALVVYDPGLSGASTRATEKVAATLQAQGYTVTLAGIKSSSASSTESYSIIVAGGPVYMGGLTNSVRDFLTHLNPDAGVAVGVFGSGQGPTEPGDIDLIKNSVPALSDGSLSDAVVVKIGETEDLDARAQDLVNQLTA
jgi:flavodoxin